MSSSKNPHKHPKHAEHPESLMMSYGYRPELSEGAIKCPIFQTSTFVFRSAEEGKAFFEVAYGHREKAPSEELGLIYSRLNNPDLEILEDRLCLWDGADDCAVFESGMSAIATVFLEFLRPGSLLLHSSPVYGGTDHFIHHILPRYGIHSLGFPAGATQAEIEELLSQHPQADQLAMVYAETPANPTNALVDIAMLREVANKCSSSEQPIYLAVDNTYMGPLWQHPLQHGADLVIYSATKYIGGHSDVIAGAVLGNQELMGRVKGLRTFMGNMAGPWTGWLLMRSLETLKVRMDRQARNAKEVADYLREHPKVQKVHYLGHLTEADGHAFEVYQKQCSTGGAMISFDIQGGEAEAFRFLNALRLMRLAVSLGSTESLAEHPATMTHSDVAPEERDLFGIYPSLVRLSIGVEHSDDIIADIRNALAQV